MSLDRSEFDRLYKTDIDPWGFRTRWYEERKRAVTLASLTRRRYEWAFEPGCSIGILTRALAQRCDRVLATDLARGALDEAAMVVPSNVELRVGAVPDEWPTRRFDLIVLSELAYYHDEATCRRLAALAATSCGELVAVHWRHPVSAYPLTGDQVHGIVGEAASVAGLALVVSHLEADFRLEVWCTDPRSVANRTGLVDS